MQRKSLLVALSEGMVAFGKGAYRVGKVVGKVLVVFALVAVVVYGGRWGVRHVVASPRFALQAVEFSDTRHTDRDDLLAAVGVVDGESLLAIDTDAVAARIARLPYIQKVKVSRSLPSKLIVDVAEREPLALASMDGLYLLDADGRAFKRAEIRETEGLSILTGISRQQYVDMRDASEAAFRAAMGLLREYQKNPNRPAVGEVAIDPRFGFSLFLRDGGTEVRVGDKDFGKKLAQLDQIFEAVTPRESGGLSALRVVHLDFDTQGRVPVLMKEAEIAVVDKKPSTPNHR